jgi:hypothetical protein
MPRPKLATILEWRWASRAWGRLSGKLRRMAVATSLSKSRKPRYCSFFERLLAT